MRISITEFLVIIMMLIALTFGVSALYERVLMQFNQSTAKRITNHE